MSTLKNINALKYLIVDLKYKAPKEIFIDGTVLYNHDEGYVSLKEILTSKYFYGNKSENDSKLINEILLSFSVHDNKFINIDIEYINI